MLKWRRQVINKGIHDKQANYRFWRVIQNKQGVMVESVGGWGLLMNGRSLLGMSQHLRRHVLFLKDEKEPAE